MRVLYLAVALVLMTTGQALSQKFGYLNAGMLLESLPEVKAAEQELNTFQKQLEDQGQAMLDKFQADYLQYLKDGNEGLLSQVEMAQREQSLGNAQQTIQNFEQEAQGKIMNKRQELLEPILKRIDEAIQAFGKENGYTFIFDSSSPGALLAVPDGDDVLEQVKAKLLAK